MRAGSIVNCQLDMQHAVMAAQAGRICHNAAHRRAQTITSLLFRRHRCGVLQEEQDRRHRSKNLLLQNP